MGFAIGVDIGGSAIKYAVVDQAGTIVWPPGREAYGGAADRVAYSVPTPGVTRLTWQATGAVEELGGEATAGSTDGSALSGEVPEDRWTVPAAAAQTALKKALARIATGFSGSIAGIGIGATGLIGRDGIVREGYAFTGYRGTDWAAVAREAGFEGRVLVLNDARAAAWAEYARAGSGDGFLHVTVGTRIGSAIVQHGELVEGADGCAGEFSYQQYIAPDGHFYTSGARLMDCSAGDFTAFGAALTGVIHVINPDRIVLRGFAPEFVAAVQSHVDRYVFKTHWRTLLDGDQAGPGTTLCVTRLDDRLTSARLSDGRTPLEGAAPDFLDRMIVCAPAPFDRPDAVQFGEIAGSFGIEAAYAARTGRRTPFEEIASLAARSDDDAATCLRRAATMTGAGIANVCRMTGAKVVTVGGAVPVLYGPYMQIVSEYVAEQYRNMGGAPTILRSAAGNDAGVIGAALYAMNTVMSPGHFCMKPKRMAR
ncbi:MAG: ROK family protein [Caldilineaceae bacterium]